MTIGERKARPATIHLATDVCRGEYVAETQPERVTMKRQLSLWGSVDRR